MTLHAGQVVPFQVLPISCAELRSCTVSCAPLKLFQFSSACLPLPSPCCHFCHGCFAVLLCGQHSPLLVRDCSMPGHHTAVAALADCDLMSATPVAFAICSQIMAQKAVFAYCALSASACLAFFKARSHLHARVDLPVAFLGLVCRFAPHRSSPVSFTIPPVSNTNCCLAVLSTFQSNMPLLTFRWNTQFLTQTCQGYAALWQSVCTPVVDFHLHSKSKPHLHLTPCACSAAGESHRLRKLRGQPRHGKRCDAAPVQQAAHQSLAEGLD